jgi:hypothetical protein
MITVLADVRFNPSPPTEVVTNNTLISLSPLKVCATANR